MRSIFGECTGNVRSTPTPKDCLRTVNVSRAPDPWRLITTPSKTCVLRRVPSITWKWTRTRSPGSNAGRSRSCSRSRVSMIVLITERARPPGSGHGARAGMVARSLGRPVGYAGSGSALERRVPFPAAVAPPLTHTGVVTGDQHVGNAVSAPLGRARVVRVLGGALERRAERLLDCALTVTERPWELAQNRVADHHRRELATRQHVRPDRDHVRGEVLVHALVEALVAAAEEREPGLCGELGGERVVEATAPRGERDHPPLPGQL